jgi:hypothetical protein
MFPATDLTFLVTQPFSLVNVFPSLDIAGGAKMPRVSRRPDQVTTYIFIINLKEYCTLDFTLFINSDHVCLSLSLFKQFFWVLTIYIGDTRQSLGMFSLNNDVVRVPVGIFPYQ